jgi:hypothetical protein
MLREPLLGCAVGRKGVGKSFQTLKMIDSYIKPNPRTGAKPRKVLILDVNDEFTQYKGIAVEDIKKFCKSNLIEARRVRIYKPNGQKMSLNEIAETLSVILQSFYGGLLLIEDINRYVSDSMPKDLIGSIVTQRHVDADIILHFQTIGRIAHPKIWGNMNWLRFHKTDDTIKRHQSKFAGETEHLEIAETMVNMKYYSGDQRFFLFFDKDSGKIRGSFSRTEFMEAVDEYLSENYNRVVSPVTNRVDLKTGKKLYKNPTEAITMIRMRMFQQYYGNPK